MDGAGKGELIQRLYEWLDPRHVRTNGYEEPDEGERQRPWMWRYWRDLPPRGEVGVVFGSWYNDLIHAHGAGDIDEAAFARGLEAVARFERMVAEEGTLILKFMLVVSEKEQRKRLRALRKNPGASRHVLEEWTALRDGNGKKSRERNREVVETVIRGTNQPHAPWIVLPSDDPGYRDLSFGRTVLNALRERLEAPAATSQPAGPGGDPEPGRPHRAGGARHGPRPGAGGVQGAARGRAGPAGVARRQQGLPAPGRGRGLRGQRRGRQGRQHPPRDRRRSTPRRFRVFPIAAPTDEERAPPLPLALLAPRAAHGPRRDLRPLVVRPRAGRARRGLRQPGRLAARLRRDQRLRGASSTAPACVVVKFWLADQQGRAAPALPASASRPRSSASRSRRRTGATARSGTTTRRPSTT